MEVESHPGGYGAAHLCSQDGGIPLPEVPHEGSLAVVPTPQVSLVLHW